MLTTMLGRTAARLGPLGRTAVKMPTMPALGAIRALSMTPSRLSDYDWNMGVPGSRIRNPAPHLYNDVYPDMGMGWWLLIGAAVSSFFYGQQYDASRPVKVDIGIFGPNMPL